MKFCSHITLKISQKRVLTKKQKSKKTTISAGKRFRGKVKPAFLYLKRLSVDEIKLTHLRVVEITFK